MTEKQPNEGEESMEKKEGFTAESLRLSKDFMSPELLMKNLYEDEPRMQTFFSRRLGI